MFKQQQHPNRAFALALICVMLIAACVQNKQQIVSNDTSEIKTVEKKVASTASENKAIVNEELGTTDKSITEEVAETEAPPVKLSEVIVMDKSATDDKFEGTTHTDEVMSTDIVEIISTGIPASYSTSHMAASLATISPMTIKLVPSLSGVAEMEIYKSDDTEDMRSDGTCCEEYTPTEETGLSSASVNAELAGKLTAGEVNDFKKWKMWEDIAEGELVNYRKVWQMNPEERYTALVLTESGAPVVDCSVELKTKSGETIWKARTDNTGKAELWGKIFTNNESKKADRIDIDNGGKKFAIDKPTTFEKGLNTIKIPVTCSIPDAVDICFTVDATGSMGDEIAYLQAELVDVINKVKAKHKDVELNLGSVFYRDHGDTYLTRNSPFTKDISKVNQFIAEQYADGGGDGPEAVDDALRASLFDMNWQKEARARLMFMILDAPPHYSEANISAMQVCVREAASRGVRIIPLVASGGGYDIDKSLEYLMRCCALGTNGTYAFLTNHSGIGGEHTAPSTDKYDVETLNKLLLRVIDEYLMVPDCNLQQFVETENPLDTISATTLVEPTPSDSLLADADTSAINIEPIVNEIVVLKCYPNPATDYIWVQTSDDVKEIYLADNSGKLMQKMTPTSTLFEMDLTNYPSGIYYLKAWINDKWVSARIVVARLR